MTIFQREPHTGPIVTAAPTTEAQRVKLLVSGMGTTRLWQCACGRIGRPEHNERDAFADWEEHRRLTCELRPRATDEAT